MKIQELLNTDEISIGKDKEITPPTKQFGRDSYAYPINNDPHMFGKSSRHPMNKDEDGYYQYIKAVEPYIDSNPYLPRVYSIRSTKTPDSPSERMHYRLEKLFTFRDVAFDQSEQLKAMMMRVLSKDTNFNDTVYNLWHYKLIPAIKSAILTNDYSAFRDSKLIHALKLIAKVLDKHPNILLDMKFDNVMLRNTPHGLQLVISDPVARNTVDKGESNVS